LTGVYHGGDLTAASQVFGEPANGWLDLSTGINPRPWPVAAAALDSLHRLPDSGRLESLRRAAAQAYGIGDPARIACGPGSQALIQWLPRLRDPGRVAVVAPTYGEHAPAWRAAGHDVFETAALPEAADCDVVVVTRPNNPDGAVADRGDLTLLASALAARGGLLVVDEAFADLDPDPSVAAAIPAGLVALRSFGKFYGLPGLRLGFAVSDAGMSARLAAAMGPWPVSSLAAETGSAALADTAWQTDTRQWLRQSAARLDGLLADAGFDIVGGTDLFRLAASDDAPDIHGRLGRAGIYTRPFPDKVRWLRFGLPGGEGGWTRLEKALTT